MKRSNVPVIVFVLSMAAGGCGAEAFESGDTADAFGALGSSGSENATPTIVRIETRENIMTIRSGPDGVRYDVAGAMGLSLDRLRIEQPDLYEIVTNATASPLHGIDARVDRSLMERNPDAP